MISPESLMMATRQGRTDEDSASFGLFEVPDVTTPPLSPLPGMSSEQPLASASTPSMMPSVPAAYDADLFYNSDVPVCIDYGQSEKAACTITEADESVDYVTEADASLGYHTERDTTSTEEASTSASSSSSSKNNNNNNDVATTSKEGEQPAPLHTILRVTVNQQPGTEDNEDWDEEEETRQRITDEELARYLQEQWHAEDRRYINRSKNSANPYLLRNGTRKKTEMSCAAKQTPTKKKTAGGRVGKKRVMQNQKTIKEAFARTKAVNK